MSRTCILLILILTCSELVCGQTRPLLNGDLTCGVIGGVEYGCPPEFCCSPSNFCGRTSAHCDGGKLFPRYQDVEGPLDFKAVADPSRHNIEPEDNRRFVMAYYMQDIAAAGFLPSEIPADLLTHIIYAFIQVNHNFQLSGDSSVEGPGGLLEQLYTETKKKNPNIQLVVSIGGAGQTEAGSPVQTVLSSMAETRERRAVFIESAISFCRRFKFDGMDLDWEFPGDPKLGGRPIDKANLVLLMQELSAAVVAEANQTGQKRLTISMALIPSPALIAYGYELEKLHNYFDWITLMTYELHYAVSTTTGPHSALKDNAQGDVEDSLYQFNMVPGHKLVIGMSAFAKTYNLAPGSTCAYGQPATGFAREPKYSEVLALLEANPGIQINHDAVTNTTYFCNNGILYTYDSPQDISTKIDYISKLGLKGNFLWSIDMDSEDFAITKAMKVNERDIVVTPRGAKKASSLSSSLLPSLLVSVICICLVSWRLQFSSMFF